MPFSRNLAGRSADDLARQVFPHYHEIARVDDLSSEELDRLPVGIIELDREGRVVSYNAAEAKLAGRAPESVIGRDFFHEVAPCANVQRFGGRFREGVEAGSLNEIFPYTFAFEPAPVDVWVKLYYSPIRESAWVFVTRRDPDTPMPRPYPTPGGDAAG